MDPYDPNYTEITTVAAYEINPEDICDCDISSMWFTECWCDAPGNAKYARVDWFGVIVRIAQNPIKTAPMDSGYTISIFKTNEHLKADVDDYDLFCPENLKAEFTVFNSLSLDYDETHIKYIKKYVMNSDNYTYVDDMSRNYAFKGQQKKGNYGKAFMSITQTMVNNFEKKKEDPKNDENPHVGRKKKGKGLRKK